MSHPAETPKLQIIDLPEEIFRKIFTYLHENDLHYNLKNTCIIIKLYVRSFVEWEKSFILQYIDGDGGFTIEAVHMIQYTKKKPRIYTKVAHPKIPLGSMAQFNISGENRLAFATTVHKKCVIGVYNGYDNDTLNVYLFDFEKHELTKIRENRPEENEGIFQKHIRASHKHVSEIIWSPIGESNIVIFEIGHWRQYNRNLIRILRFVQGEEDSILTYSSYYSVPPKDLETLTRFCIVQKDKSEILIVGGIDSEQSGFLNQIIWSGMLSDDNTRIVWKDSGHRIPYTTTCSIVCFFISDNIYIIEGLPNQNFFGFEDYRLCNRYDWKEKKYYYNIFPRPFQSYGNPGNCGNIVNIKENEKFEIIAIHTKTKYEFSHMRQLWVFTEKEGFHEASCFYTSSKMIKGLEKKCTNEKVSRSNKKFLLSFFKR